MRAADIEVDVITCCSLISALESGGQWLPGLQLFLQMCLGQRRDGSHGPLYKVGLELQRMASSLVLTLLTAPLKEAPVKLIRSEAMVA